MLKGIAMMIIVLLIKHTLPHAEGYYDDDDCSIDSACIIPVIIQY